MILTYASQPAPRNPGHAGPVAMNRRKSAEGDLLAGSTPLPSGGTGCNLFVIGQDPGGRRRGGAPQAGRRESALPSFAARLLLRSGRMGV